VSEDGVSGALRAAYGPGAAALTEKQIEALIRACARMLYWRVEGFGWRRLSRSYHRCFVAKDGAPFEIVAHAEGAVMALTDRQDDPVLVGEPTFLEMEGFASALAQVAPYATALSASELNQDLSDADRAWLRQLSPRMAYDLKYWSPQTVGDVVFNFWD
jgi:hypothetical protein